MANNSVISPIIFMKLGVYILNNVPNTYVSFHSHNWSNVPYRRFHVRQSCRVSTLNLRIIFPVWCQWIANYSGICPIIFMKIGVYILNNVPNMYVSFHWDNLKNVPYRRFHIRRSCRVYALNRRVSALNFHETCRVYTQLSWNLACIYSIMFQICM